MSNPALYMTPEEHERSLAEGGFASVHEVHREGGLVLYRAQVERLRVALC